MIAAAEDRDSGVPQAFPQRPPNASRLAASSAAQPSVSRTINRSGFAAAGGVGGPKSPRQPRSPPARRAISIASLPHILDRARMYAVRAHAGRLALAAVDAPLSRLERNVAAVRGGPDDGATDLRADGRGKHHGGDGRGRTGGGAAGGARRIERIRRWARMRSAHSAVTVLPTITAPACRSAHTAALSRFGKLSRYAAQPISVGMSFVSSRSLMPMGRPSIGERAYPSLPGVVLLRPPRAHPPVQRHERPNDRLALGNRLEAALQIRAGRVGAVRKRATASWKVRARTRAGRSSSLPS